MWECDEYLVVAVGAAGPAFNTRGRWQKIDIEVANTRVSFPGDNGDDCWCAWQTGWRSGVGFRRRTARLSGEFRAGCLAGVIRKHDVGQTVGPDVHLHEIEQRTVRATECSACADLAVVNDVGRIRLHNCEHRFAAVAVERLREIELPRRTAGQGIWISHGAGGVPNNVDTAVVARGDPREYRGFIRGQRPAADREWTVESLSVIVRRREPDTELVSPRIVHAPGNVNVARR